MKLYVLADANHDGDEGIHGIFSTLAYVEQYQFDHQLHGMMTSIVQMTIDYPEENVQVPQLLRLSARLEAKLIEKAPNYKAEKLAQSVWFCEDCQKQLTCCWECGFFHCKCGVEK